MELVRVLECFKVFENGMVTLIELNHANLDLTWNLVIYTFSIFDTSAIEHIMAIIHVEWGHFGIIYPILINFYGCDVSVVLTNMNNDEYKSYGYQSNTIIIFIGKIQCIILIFTDKIIVISLVLFYYFSYIFILPRMKSSFILIGNQ